MWSLEEYCESQQEIDQSLLHASSRSFLQALNLPSIHPFCTSDDFLVDGVPPMGRLVPFQDMNVLEIVATIYSMAAPALLALAELWLRLFAGLLGPLGICYLLRNEVLSALSKSENKKQEKQNSKGNTIFLVSTLSMAGSLVLMTDTLYVLSNGNIYGCVMFIVSVILSIRANKGGKGFMMISFMVLLASHLVYDYETNSIVFGNPIDQVSIEEGLYYNDNNNPYVSSIVQHWPESDRTYHPSKGATSWMPSGDSRTGLPFLLNGVGDVTWHRVFLPTEDDEYVALDISFPTSGEGFNSSKPIYMILHGLNGGSDEEYVKDFALRSTAEGCTVVVMIARGLMDLPIRGWNLFHGARTSDAHSAAVALRQAFGKDQVIIGVGYSMGAIILNNYVASSGPGCPLDAAMAVSGGLDMRYQKKFTRAQRLWQPMLTETARDEFFLGKWGYRVRERLSESNFHRLVRAKHITELDIVAVAPYSGFDDVDHYYTEMSALGDVPHRKDDDSMDEFYSGTKQIDNVSIPLVVLQALDDPLITWRSTCANHGLMHPNNLVKTGKGNVILLLTKGGGHVGWPVGFLFFQNQWKWMSNAVSSFGTAVQEVKRLQQQTG